MSVPYNADIIAHERMSAFAYISILEVVLKLAIVYVLYIIPGDKLITYAVLILSVQFVIRFVYARYCRRHFEESHYRHTIDKSLFKEMFTFAGWSFWGNLAGVLYTQGLNIMLNMFFGPIVNAARGIAVQVQSAVQQFVNNFQIALNPQITKNYAIGHLTHMHNLMFRSARFSFFLLFFLTLPVLLETDFLLSIWLKVVPTDAVVFTRWMLGVSLLHTMANPCAIANQATGKVKVYQAVVGGLLLMILPISYVVLRLGAPAYSVFIVHFFVETIAQLARIYMLRKLINLPVIAYWRNVYAPVFIVIFVSCLLPIYINHQLSAGWNRFLIVGMSCVISVGISVFLLGLTSDERGFFYDKFLRFLRIK